MATLIVGASGATGRLLAEQLLKRGQQIRVIVRSPEKLPDILRNNDNVSVIHASLLELSDVELIRYVKGCDAIASCLGHNLTFRGVFGKPRQLVTEAVRRLCNAVRENKAGAPVKFVLMNTAGNRNRDLVEPVSLAQHGVIWLLRLLLPPHPDNERAADFLRSQVGQNNAMLEWVAVRPDTLVEAPEVSAYDVHPSPTRSAIFNAGKTSRINVGHFMAELITNPDTWAAWRGQMPVVYNSENPVGQRTSRC